MKITSVPFPVFHLLTQFGRAVTYNTFVNLGLITSVAVSAGKVYSDDAMVLDEWQ